jgi:hypothetical protein
MILPSLTIAEAAALLVWMALERGGRDISSRLLESAKDCVTGDRKAILAGVRWHFRRSSTDVDDDYDRCAAYIMLAAARGLG